SCFGNAKRFAKRPANAGMVQVLQKTFAIAGVKLRRRERELPAISYLVRGPSRYPRAESLAVGHLNHSRVEIKSHDMARGSGDNCEVNGRCTWSTSNIEDVRPRLEAKGLDRLQPKLTYGRCRRYLAQIRRRNVG